MIITGCVSQAKIIRGEVSNELILRPLPLEFSKVTLGDKMMSQAFGWYVDCISPNLTKSETFSMGIYTLELKANQEMCGDSIGTNEFEPSYKIITNDVSNHSVVEVVKKDGTSDLCMSGLTSFCLNYKNDEISRGTSFRARMNSLQQSIEYMGRDGDSVKFLYTEFNDEMASPALNREFIVDLSKGNTLNFKGAEVEIINATNTSLEYRVISYFN